MPKPITCILCNMSWYFRKNLIDHLRDFHRITVPASDEVAEKLVIFLENEQILREKEEEKQNAAANKVDQGMSDGKLIDKPILQAKKLASKQPKVDEKEIVLKKVEEKPNVASNKVDQETLNGKPIQEAKKLASNQPGEDEKKAVSIPLKQPEIHCEVKVSDKLEKIQHRSKLKLFKNFHYGCYKFQCNMCPFKHNLKSGLYLHRKKTGHYGQTIVKTMQVKLDDFEKNEKFTEGSLVDVLMVGFPRWPAIILKDKKTGLFRKFEKGPYKTKKTYSVYFFDKKDKMTHAWICESKIKKYPFLGKFQSNRQITKVVEERMAAAKEWATYVADWSEEDRVEYFTQ